MNRKDMILVAVLVNAGLLAILFITAVIYETDIPLEHLETSSIVAVNNTKPVEIEKQDVPVEVVPSPVDVDNGLDFMEAPPPETVPAEPIQEVKSPETSPAKATEFVEVVVKKGDTLEKIAKANGSTISAIKKANGLVNESLSIGQQLKIPLTKKKAAATGVTESTEVQYYILKSGDNPWKIAKQFNLKYEDILRLNNMDEDKAKNLKPGDRIRIK